MKISEIGLFIFLGLMTAVAPVLAPVAGGQILRWTDWRGVFYVLTGIGLLLALSCIPCRETLPKGHRLPRPTAAFRSYPHLFHDSYFMGHCLLEGFLFISFFGYLAGFYFLWPLHLLIPILIITVIPLSITETVSMSMALSRQGKNAGAASALLGFFTVAPGSLTMPLTGIAGEDTALPLGLLMTGGYALCLLSYWKWVHGR